jgi:hypothetical protein
MSAGIGGGRGCAICRTTSHQLPSCRHVTKERRCLRCLGEGHRVKVCPLVGKRGDPESGCSTCTLPLKEHPIGTEMGKKCVNAPLDSVVPACWAFLRLRKAYRRPEVVEILGRHLPSWAGDLSEFHEDQEASWYGWLLGKWVEDGLITNGAVLFYLLHRARDGPVASEVQAGLSLSYMSL